MRRGADAEGGFEKQRTAPPRNIFRAEMNLVLPSKYVHA